MEEIQSYFEMDLPIFAVCRPKGGNGGCKHHEHCQNPGKTPLVRGWQRGISKKRARELFERWPDANVGISLGSASGIIVLDFDLWPMPADVDGAPLSYTSRGAHAFYKYDARFWKTHKLTAHIDLRAESSFVVLPESEHISGAIYEWKRPLFDFYELPPLPSFAVELYREAGSFLLKRPLRDMGIIKGVPQGQRNDSATRVIGKLIGRWAPSDWGLAWELALAWNDRNRPPLSEAELWRCFDSIATMELRKAANTPKAKELLSRLTEYVQAIPEASDREIQRKFNGHRHQGFNRLLQLARLTANNVVVINSQIRTLAA